jgi:hypothetical protein
MFKNPIQRAIMVGAMMVVVMLLAAFFAISAQTHAAPPATQSNISQKPAGLAHYSPKTLACKRVIGLPCITIKNTTVATQTVTQSGKVVYTLTRGQIQNISYTAAGTYTYGLSSNAQATLTVTVS